MIMSLLCLPSEWPPSPWTLKSCSYRFRGKMIVWGGFFLSNANRFWTERRCSDCVVYFTGFMYAGCCHHPSAGKYDITPPPPPPPPTHLNKPIWKQQSWIWDDAENHMTAIIPPAVHNTRFCSIVSVGNRDRDRWLFPGPAWSAR